MSCFTYIELYVIKCVYNPTVGASRSHIQLYENVSVQYIHAVPMVLLPHVYLNQSQSVIGQSAGSNRAAYWLSTVVMG